MYKLGEMVIDPKQVFWKRQYIYACIPFVQLLKGRTHTHTQMSSSHPEGWSPTSKIWNPQRCLI